MKKIYVCSPYRSMAKDPKKNAMEVRAHRMLANSACGLVTAYGYLPLAPHLFFTEFLDDSNPTERELGMKLGLELLKEADEVWVFGNRVSKGMFEEIYDATDLEIPVKDFQLSKSEQVMKKFFDASSEHDKGCGRMEAMMQESGYSPDLIDYVTSLGIPEVIFKTARVEAKRETAEAVDPSHEFSFEADFEYDDEFKDSEDLTEDTQDHDENDFESDSYSEDPLTEAISVVRELLTALEKDQTERDREGNGKSADADKKRGAANGTVLKLHGKE